MNIRILCLMILLTSIIFSVGLRSQNRVLASTDSASPCNQSTADREALMNRAEKESFTVRRVEFVNTTYTPDQVLRRRLINFNEGDIFRRQNLVASLRNMSKLRNEIYPAKLKDVELGLNEPEKTIDVTICFKPKRR